MIKELKKKFCSHEYLVKDMYVQETIFPDVLEIHNICNKCGHDNTVKIPKCFLARYYND